jgi:hypothetical protein
LLVLEGIEGRLKSLEGIEELGRNIEGYHREIGELVRRLESLEGRLKKVAICESLEGRLKATIVIFNHHWRAKEVGS